MEKILIEMPDSRSEIRVGENWQNVSAMIPPGTVIITDSNVFDIYGKHFPPCPVFSIEPGEGSKQLSTIGYLAGRLLEAGVDRSGFVLAIGGGVVCDIAGFLASVYMRGIRTGYVSTTLLSQVDASTGGKTGVDHAGVKNIIGTIRQPEFVICDPTILLSLPGEEYLSGLAELVKSAAIGDPVLFSILEEDMNAVLRRNTIILETMITRSVRFKASVVLKDEKENGLRRILNFGHTFGHALEAELGIKHGFAVAAGMKLAAAFSVERKFCSPEAASRLTEVLGSYGFPDLPLIPVQRMKELIMHDKKRSGSSINFVFLCDIGKASISGVSPEELLDFYKRYSKDYLS